MIKTYYLDFCTYCGSDVKVSYDNKDNHIQCTTCGCISPRHDIIKNENKCGIIITLEHVKTMVAKQRDILNKSKDLHADENMRKQIYARFQDLFWVCNLLDLIGQEIKDGEA